MDGDEIELPSGATLPAGELNTAGELEPITGFACIIEYDGGQARAISCRKYETIGDHHYVGAICSQAKGWRRFRCDRMGAVTDLVTGEVLGDGTFFHRFSVDSAREVKDTWGLPRSRHAHLVAGLNVLAFMAYCDGEWHPLEQETLEEFVCSMWLRKEWDGDPPLDRIVAHAQRLAPDANVFGASLKNFVNSSTSERLLRRFMNKVICADGRITDDEHKWAMHYIEVVDEFARACRDGSEPVITLRLHL